MHDFKHKDWRVNASLLPGQKGTLGPYKEYGDKLVCVRYRYNATRNRRIKTVEIVIEEKPWRTEVSERRKRELADKQISPAEMEKIVQAVIIEAEKKRNHRG